MKGHMMHAFDERLGRAGKVWLGLMVCLSAVCSAFAAPRLDIPSEGISLGEVPVGVEAVGRIGLRNVGDAAVSVSGVKACCGARAELSATVIPPAGSAVLTVSLAPQEVGAFSKTVRILCDDPERPVLSVPAECIAGLGLVFSRRVRLFAGAVAVLLVVFLVALSQAALRGLDVSCGCFGGVSSGALGPAIVRDVLLLAVSLWLFLDSSRHLEVQ